LFLIQIWSETAIGKLFLLKLTGNYTNQFQQTQHSLIVVISLFHSFNMTITENNIRSLWYCFYV